METTTLIIHQNTGFNEPSSYSINMKTKKAEQYLDKEFPKGKTKFRGQAMVLIALSREEERKRILKLIDKSFYELSETGWEQVRELKQKINSDKLESVKE